eukprot:31354-Pelagococcus_subviridis.AAC.16
MFCFNTNGARDGEEETTCDVSSTSASSSSCVIVDARAHSSVATAVSRSVAWRKAHPTRRETSTTPRINAGRSTAPCVSRSVFGGAAAGPSSSSSMASAPPPPLLVDVARCETSISKKSPCAFASSSFSFSISLEDFSARTSSSGSSSLPAAAASSAAASSAALSAAAFAAALRIDFATSKRANGVTSPSVTRFAARRATPPTSSTAPRDACSSAAKIDLHTGWLSRSSRSSSPPSPPPPPSAVDASSTALASPPALGAGAAAGGGGASVASDAASVAESVNGKDGAAASPPSLDSSPTDAARRRRVVRVVESFVSTSRSTGALASTSAFHRFAPPSKSFSSAENAANAVCRTRVALSLATSAGFGSNAPLISPSTSIASNAPAVFRSRHARTSFPASASAAATTPTPSISATRNRDATALNFGTRAPGPLATASLSSFSYIARSDAYATCADATDACGPRESAFVADEGSTRAMISPARLAKNSPANARGASRSNSGRSATPATTRSGGDRVASIANVHVASMSASSGDASPPRADAGPFPSARATASDPPSSSSATTATTAANSRGERVFANASRSNSSTVACAAPSGLPLGADAPPASRERFASRPAADAAADAAAPPASTRSGKSDNASRCAGPTSCVNTTTSSRSTADFGHITRPTASARITPGAVFVSSPEAALKSTDDVFFPPPAATHTASSASARFAKPMKTRCLLTSDDSSPTPPAPPIDICDASSESRSAIEASRCRCGSAARKTSPGPPRTDASRNDGVFAGGSNADDSSLSAATLPTLPGVPDGATTLSTSALT